MAKKKEIKKPQIIYAKDKKQKGSSNKFFDRLYSALPPGKRKSKSGNVYYEYRKNRTDKTNSLEGIGDMLYNQKEFNRDKQDLQNTIIRLNYLEDELVQLKAQIKYEKDKAIKSHLNKKLQNRRRQLAALKKYFNTIAVFVKK